MITDITDMILEQQVYVITWLVFRTKPGREDRSLSLLCSDTTVKLVYLLFYYFSFQQLKLQ